MEHPDLVRLTSRSPSRGADAVSRVFDPLVLVTALSVAVSIEASGSVSTGVGWALLTVVTCAAIPELSLRVLVRTGRRSDRQLVRREDRGVPLLIALASVGAGVTALAVLGAPRALVAFVVTLLAGLAVMTALTHLWKASFHANAAASSAVVLVAVFGGATLLLGVPVVLAVAWARVRGGRHSPAQVAAGVIIGTAVAALVFPALR